MFDHVVEHHERSKSGTQGGVRFIVILLCLGLLSGFAVYEAFHEDEKPINPDNEARVAMLNKIETANNPPLAAEPASSPDGEVAQLDHPSADLRIRHGSSRSEPARRVKPAATLPAPTARATPADFADELSEYPTSTDGAIASKADAPVERKAASSIPEERITYEAPAPPNFKMPAASAARPRRSVVIVDYPTVRDLKLLDAVQWPGFAVKIRSSKQLIIEGRSIESGEYTLKLEERNKNWYLLFSRTEADSDPVALLLSREPAPYETDTLVVASAEIGNRASLRIHMGAEQLIGYFLIQ